MTRRPRVAVPLEVVAPHLSILTWFDGASRIVRPLATESLGEVARLWTAQRVLEWFGRLRRTSVSMADMP